MAFVADSILFNLASKTIEKLASSAIQELSLAWNVKQDMRKLQNTLSMIRDVILDAEEQAGNIGAVRDWVARLNDAVYDVDDLLEDLSTESLLRKARSGDGKARQQVRNFFSKSNQNQLVFGFKMGRRTKGLRERLDAISDEMRMFGFNVRLPNITNNRRRENYSFVLEEQVIGREKEKKAIIDFLLGNCSSSSNSYPVNMRNVSVVSIVGVGGSGKTTLAQLVFKDELVREHFELKIWVPGSDDGQIDVKKIGEKILGDGAATHNNRGLEQVRNYEQVLNDARKKMHKKRFLVVLDDVWDENHENWLRLKDLLLDRGAEGSMVIVTARSRNVARITSSDFTHLLQGLDDEHSWALFSQLAFEKKKGRRDTTSRNWKTDCKDMCRGTSCHKSHCKSLEHPILRELLVPL